MGYESIPISALGQQRLGRDESPDPRVVLVVDDERVIADTLTAILKNAGYAATAAYDGESALEMARIVPPELLLTDVMMPGMSGVKLAIAVRQAVPDCRVLLFSGQAATVDLLEEASTAGHDFTLLAKPIHPHDLLASLQE